MAAADLRFADMPASLQTARMEALKLADAIPLFNTGEPAPDFYDTPTAIRIMKVARRCRNRRHMGLIVGEPGIGKTTALRRFAETEGGLPLISLDATVTTINAVLCRICLKLGGEHTTKTRVARERIVGLLKPHRRGLLLIDEMQHANDGAVEALRGIHDELGIGMLFCGNASFRRRLSPDREGFGQISSRIGIRAILKRSQPGDVEVICDRRGISDADARGFLINQSRTVGALRLVLNLIDGAEELAGSAGAIRVNHLKDALFALGDEA